jgi:hypothetical protein
LVVLAVAVTLVLPRFVLPLKKVTVPVGPGVAPLPFTNTEKVAMEPYVEGFGVALVICVTVSPWPMMYVVLPEAEV